MGTSSYRSCWCSAKTHRSTKISCHRLNRISTSSISRNSRVNGKAFSTKQFKHRTLDSPRIFHHLYPHPRPPPSNYSSHSKTDNNLLWDHIDHKNKTHSTQSKRKARFRSSNSVVEVLIKSNRIYILLKTQGMDKSPDSKRASTRSLVEVKQSIFEFDSSSKKKAIRNFSYIYYSFRYSIFIIS